MGTSREFLSVMRKFPTGVVLLTAIREDGSVKAMTVNSVTSVTLEPPLILVSVGRERNTYSHICRTQRFSINILSVAQDPVARFFSKEDQPAEKYPTTFTFSKSGYASVDGCIAFLGCKVVATHEYGDHSLFIGEVEDALIKDGQPLVFFESKYTCLNPPA